MSRRRVLLFTIAPPMPRNGSSIAYGVFAYSSDRVAFVAPGFGGPDTPFSARISSDDDVVIERSVSVWPLGRSASQRAGMITLLNGDRALDGLLGVIGKDWRFDLRWCWDDEAADPTHTWAACTRWQSGLIDNVSTDGDNRRIIIALADPLAYLDVPLQKTLYPDNAPNAAARGKPRPVTLGTARFAGGVLRDTDELGADKWIYDMHDDRVLGVTAAYDKGDIFVANTDWKYPADRRGIQLQAKPDRPVTATLAGQHLPGAQTMHTDFVTDPWPSGVPTGWERYAGSKVAGGWRMNAAGAGSLAETTAISLLPSRSYRVRVVCSAATSGTVFVTPFITHNHIDAVAISAPGTYDAIIPATTGNRFVRFRSAAACDVTIASVTIEEIHDTARLPRFVQAVLNRVPGSAAADAAAVNALDTAAPYSLGTYQASPITALSLLRQALDGWCGWVTSTRDGRLTVGRLRKRGGAVGSVRLGRGQIITVRRSNDTAPGLATRLAGLRNHTVHSDSDIATSLDDALRAELQAEYTIKTGVGSMPGAYAHAVGADPQPTLLQDAAQLQTAASYVTDLFRQPLTWYEVDAAISAEVADGLEMGDWIHVTHPVAGLDAGKWLCLMGAAIRFRGRRATLTLLDIPE